MSNLSKALEALQNAAREAGVDPGAVLSEADEVASQRGRRRVTVRRRQSEEKLFDKLVNERIEEILAEERQAMFESLESEYESKRKEMEAEKKQATKDARDSGYNEGIAAERNRVEGEMDAKIIEHLVDPDKKLPWVVGVFMAGAEHYVLQALAKHIGQDEAEAFSREYLGETTFPRDIDAPPRYTHAEVCDDPPDMKRLEFKYPGHSPHWKKYLDGI